MEKELLSLGFFLTIEDKENQFSSFRLWQSYKDVFIRIIINKQGDTYSLEHLYIDTKNWKDLQKELFSDDLSIQNIITGIKKLRLFNLKDRNRPETE